MDKDLLVKQKETGLSRLDAGGGGEWSSDRCMKGAAGWTGRRRGLGKAAVGDHPPNAAAIARFAAKQGIAPSVVLGWLQRREKWVSPGLGNTLKHRIAIDWNGLKAAC